jgi:hypothetical protein
MPGPRVLIGGRIAADKGASVMRANDLAVSQRTIRQILRRTGTDSRGRAGFAGQPVVFLRTSGRDHLRNRLARPGRVRRPRLLLAGERVRDGVERAGTVGPNCPTATPVHVPSSLSTAGSSTDRLTPRPYRQQELYSFCNLIYVFSLIATPGLPS